MVQISRLIFEPLALADIPHERVDAQPVAALRSVGVRGDFNPHRCGIFASEPQQVVRYCAVPCETIEEGGPCLRVDEAQWLKRPDVGRGRLGRIAEHELQMRVGGDRRVLRSSDDAQVHPLVDRLEETVQRAMRRAASLCAARGAAGHTAGWD